MTDRRGRFITFEGTDGCGKTTQMRLLADRLTAEGREVVETQEPGGTEIGLKIRQILLDPTNERLCPVAEMLLYFAARAQNFDQLILPAWDRGAVVLSDRFTDSTLAYQGGGRELGESVVMRLHEIACHGLLPDLTVYIDVDLETSLSRMRARSQAEARPDRIEEQAAEFHDRVRQAYLRLAAAEPARIKVVDGRGTISEVADRVWAVVEPALHQQSLAREQAVTID
jgi:dTMP kinase